MRRLTYRLVTFTAQVENGYVSMFRSGFVLAVLVLTGSFHPVPLFPRLCAQANPGYAFDRADAVFVGKVLDEAILRTFDNGEINRIARAYEEHGDSAVQPLIELFVEMRNAVRWKVRVDETFKGVTVGEIVYFYGAEREHRGSDERGLSVGSSELFYASFRDPEGFATGRTGAEEFDAGSIFDRSRALEEADNDLHWLRELRRRPRGGYIFGHIGLDEAMSTAATDGKITVELKLDSEVLRTTPLDGKGRFAFEELGAGDYTVAFIPPKSLDPDPVVRSVVLRHDHDAVELIWRMEKRRFHLHLAGRIQGRVLDRSGRPAQGVLVMEEARTDSEGRYAATHLEPGDHDVYVDFDERAKKGSSRLYFPGTLDRSPASRLTLEPGEILNLPNMMIPVELQPCAIRGLVVDDTGHSVENADVYVDRTYGYPQTKTGDGGEFSLKFSIHHQRRLIACLSVSRGRRKGPDYFSAVLKIPAGECPSEPLRLVLQRAKDCSGP